MGSVRVDCTQLFLAGNRVCSHLMCWGDSQTTGDNGHLQPLDTLAPARGSSGLREGYESLRIWRVVLSRVSVARAPQQDLHPIDQLKKLLSFSREVIQWSSILLFHRLNQRHVTELPKVFLSLHAAQIGVVHDCGL